MKSAFETSGTSPTEIEPDFRVENHGSLFLLQPLSPAANSIEKYRPPTDHREQIQAPRLKRTALLQSRYKIGQWYYWFFNAT
jgi:hypothetical protein